MEKNQKMALGGLLAAGALVGAAYFGGLFSNENDAIRRAASVAAPAAVAPKTTSPTDPQPQPSGPTTTISYEKDKFEYGIIDEGAVVKHTFKFKNTGNEPLIISNARASCGCTVPSWPKEAVPPGGEGKIDVSFDSKGKPGKQSKRVTVIANTTPTETFLTIEGEVRGKEQPQTAKGK